MAKTILVITDKHEHENCSLKKAHDIAAPLGEDIEVVRFIKDEDEHSDATMKASQDELSATLTDIFADYEHKESIKSQVVVTKNIAKWVTEYCQTKDFDLIIKTGHRSETFFHTPCDWELIRKLKVPVLIANHHRWKSNHSVMVALNPKPTAPVHIELNNTILNWAKKWAETFDSQIHVVYCMPISSLMKDLDFIDVKKYEKEHKSEGEALLAKALEGFDIPNLHTHVTAGPPEKVIPHCANDIRAELVIMGSMGRKGLHSMLKGNVAEKVMHHLRTDSLIVEGKK